MDGATRQPNNLYVYEVNVVGYRQEWPRLVGQHVPFLKWRLAVF